MYMPTNNGGGDFTPPPAGAHAATCYRVIDLGTQHTEFQGQAKLQRKVLISWEITDERMEDGKPFVIAKRYTFSSHEKAVLRKDLEAWRGLAFKESDFGPGGFNIKTLLGKSCLLSIVHAEKEGKTYGNIASLSRLPRQMNASPLENEIVYLSLEPNEFDVRAFDKLSDGLKEQIRKSPEYAALAAPSPHDAAYGESRTMNDLDDDIPF